MSMFLPRVRSGVRILPDAVRVLRALAPSSENPSKRIYISREGAWRRSILNHAEVAAVLRSHDFAVLDPGELTVSEQIEIFSSAEAIVGLHGAGLTNITFAPPGATVVELQPAGLDWARTVLFWNVAAVAGHRYAQVVCASHLDHPRMNPSEAHVSVDVEHLDQVLDELLPPR